MLRIPVREQLAALILLASLIGLSVISIATWVTVDTFVLDLRKNRLAYTASLKAAQLSSNLAIMQHSVQCIATRIIIGQTLQRYNAFGDNSQADWADAANDLRAAITSTVPSGSALALQGMVFGLNGTGPGGPYGLLNATIDGVDNQVRLPTNYPNGTSAFLGDTGLGYPSMLYPNFTYTGHVNNDSSVDATASFQGVTLTAKSDLLVLGPYQFNDSLSLLSVTVPIVDLLDVASTLGWVTVVFDASLIKAVVNSSAALDETAAALLVGPSQAHNIFPSGVLFNSENRNDTAIKDQEIRYVLPLPSNLTERHPDHTVGTANPPFLMSSYPAIEAAFTKDHQAINNAGGNLKSVNEAGIDISTGFALVDFPSVNWAIVIEESRAQVWSPITKLRHVLTACVCATIGAFVLFAWPLAHFVSRPIRDLRAATMKSVMPPGYDENHDSDSDTLDGEHQNHILARKEGFFAVSNLWRKGAKRSSSEREEDARRRQFRIPGKVPERKHVVRDELTDLTSVYNEMSDELMMQYERLEERVRLRTAELELSKKAAEAANESKTLFIANISHELKTPLNGILGMCAVCMQEDDPVRLKRSLGIIYKSGDLLLNLLTDLLTFSKNQAGQQLSLDEKEFRLRDISSQVLAIFERQAKEGDIRLEFKYKTQMEGDTDIEDSQNASFGASRLKDMVLWGDTHRILQVIINLVSNSLKFTPPGGSVSVTIRCLGQAPDNGTPRNTSIASTKNSKRISSRKRNSDISYIGSKTGNSPDFKSIESIVHVTEMDKQLLPPPGRNLMFEFVVTDTGPGIPQESHQRIFEPFVQGDLGLSKKYGGTGLGLSICSQLAGLMKGKMGIQSEVGEGSRFSMTIPLKLLYARADSNASSMADLRAASDDGQIAVPVGSRSPTKASEEHPRLVGLSQPFFATNEPMESPGSQPAAMEQITAAAASTGRIRVLVAEDNKVNQEVVLRMLKLEEIYDVTVAKDGQEALDMVKESMQPPRTGAPAHKGPFNLIFMDVQMPNLDGLQSTRLIREIGYDAPIVALTAFAEESNVKDCLDSGMNHFLSKPIRRPALKKVLNQYCAPIQEVDEEVSPPPTKLTHDVPSTDGTTHTRSRSGEQKAVFPPSAMVAQSPKTTVMVISRPASKESEARRE